MYLTSRRQLDDVYSCYCCCDRCLAVDIMTTFRSCPGRNSACLLKFGWTEQERDLVQPCCRLPAVRALLEILYDASSCEAERADSKL